jgi:ankyrin repeat protein
VFSALNVVSLFAAAPDPRLADAVKRMDRAAIHALLDQHADVNAPQVDGATALHWAIYRDDEELVDLLIRSGANIKAANRDGATPLAMAALYGKPSIVYENRPHLGSNRLPLIVRTLRRAVGHH